MARNLGHAIEHLHWEFWKGGFLHLSEAGGACWLTLWNTTHPPRKEGCASSLNTARAQGLWQEPDHHGARPCCQVVSLPQHMDLCDPQLQEANNSGEIRVPVADLGVMFVNKGAFHTLVFSI